MVDSKIELMMSELKVELKVDLKVELKVELKVQLGVGSAGEALLTLSAVSE